ncbi:MAG: hypothetical protein ACREMQ_04650 [Longimicrobiales bacterium]
MGLPRISRISAALAVVLVAGACASGSGTETTTTTTPARTGSGMSIRVENNRPGGNTVIVHVVPEVGVRRQLGEVPPGSTGTFSFTGAPGYYTLVAVGGGSDLNSQRFRIFENTTNVRWDMSTNRVTAT